jgi:hypothetical protein
VPGKFLVAAIGYAGERPPPGEVSRQAIDDNHSSERIDPSPQRPPAPDSDGPAPGAVLRAALSFTPGEEVTVP